MMMTRHFEWLCYCCLLCTLILVTYDHEDDEVPDVDVDGDQGEPLHNWVPCDPRHRLRLPNQLWQRLQLLHLWGRMLHRWDWLSHRGPSCSQVRKLAVTFRWIFSLRLFWILPLTFSFTSAIHRTDIVMMDNEQWKRSVSHPGHHHSYEQSLGLI